MMLRMVSLSHALKLYLGVSRGMWCDGGTGFYDVKDGKPVTCLKTVSGSK